MRSAYQRSAASDRSSLRRRAVALVLTLVAHLLLLIGFLTLTPSATSVIRQSALQTFNLLPDPAAVPKTTRSAARKTASGVPKQKAMLPRPVVPPILKKPAFPAIALTSDEFAAADISKLPSHKGEGSARIRIAVQLPV